MNSKEQTQSSEYQDSCRLWPQISSSEPQEQQDSTERKTSSVSEQSTEPSKKCSDDGRSSSRPKQRQGCRPTLPHSSDVWVAISKKGIPIGESAARAKYTDKEIGFVFALREEGKSYSEIARLMDMPRSTCHAIICGKMRAQVVDRWKKRKS